MDILEQLLGLEKQAAALVTAADTVAGQRKAAARVEAQTAHSAELKKVAGEIAASVEAERSRLAGERIIICYVYYCCTVHINRISYEFSGIIYIRCTTYINVTGGRINRTPKPAVQCAG